MKKLLLVLTLVNFLHLVIPQSSAMASEQSTYDFSWLDKDKTVFVLQNRMFRKSGKAHILLGGGKTVSGAFVDSYTAQARVGYFFKEEWGAEFFYGLTEGSENETAKSLRNEGGSGSVPFRRIVNNYMGGQLLWSPFYAKVNTFNKIIYFDWMLGVGAAKIEESNNQVEFRDGLVVPDTVQTHTAYLWSTALQFYLSPHWMIRSDLMAMSYQADKGPATKVTWNSNYDLSLALGFYF